MKLGDWLKSHTVTLRQFGERIGKSEASVSRIVRGLDNTDRETMLAIIRETEGQVTAADLLAPAGSQEGASAA